MQCVREGCPKDSMQCVREGCPKGSMQSVSERGALEGCPKDWRSVVGQINNAQILFL